MTVRLMTVEANEDAPTRAAYAYRDLYLYQKLDTVGTNLLTLRGPLATPAYFTPRIATHNPDYLVAVGHGDEDTLTGYHGVPLLEIGHYQAADVAGRVVHLLACHTAATLGPDLVRNGARAFIGYNWFVMVHEGILDEFLECDTAIDEELLGGATISQAYWRAIELFDGHIARLKGEGRLMKAALLETNRDSLMCPVTDRRLGRSTATL
jgi:hypothetical protein